MFIYTAKLSKKNLILGSILLGVVLIGIILLWPKPSAYGVLSEQMLESEMVAITIGNIKTNEDRIIFLSEHGLNSSDNEIECKTVQIPSEFDESYLKYNEIQLQQGFDLSKFKGKSVQMYTYEIFDYNDTQEQVFANILIYNDKIIGGDISSASLDGFMFGFE